MIWQRIRRLWRLSSPEKPLPWGQKIYDEVSNMSYEEMAQIIPYQKIDPIKKITEEHAD